MSDEKFRPLNTPECNCFDFDDYDYAMGSCEAVAGVCQAAMSMVVGKANEANLCKKAMPFVMETLMITIIHYLAIANTAIEPGTPEALWESERVLKGLEQRLLDVIRHNQSSWDEVKEKTN